MKARADQVAPYERQILGIPFFVGTAGQAVARMLEQGGLLVAPAAPALKDLPTNRPYSEALLAADTVITDSGLMVLLWNLMTRDRVTRLSGLEYLTELVGNPDFCKSRIFWIMASQASADRNVEWLRSQGLTLRAADVYLAPFYGDNVVDDDLVALLRDLKPDHVIITIGGGTQERLGHLLKEGLGYRPGIHCIGAAMAFLSGDQVRIPAWADQLYLGWLCRCVSEPKRYVSRYWHARKLFGLMWRYRDGMPPFSPTKADCQR